MPLRAIPARGGLGWAWCTPAWALMVRPTISAAVAAVVRAAVIQRRIRRVIAVSFTRCVPAVCGSLGFEATAPADGISRRRAARRPPACRAADAGRPRGRAPRIAAAPVPRCALVNGVEGDSCEGRVGVGVVDAG